MRGITRLIFGSLVCVLTVLLACCQQQIKAPKPSLRKIVPADMPAGQPAFTLEVGRHEFYARAPLFFGTGGRAARFSSPPRNCTRRSSRPISRMPARPRLVVQTASPGGGTTKSLTFTIDADHQRRAADHVRYRRPAASTGGTSFLLMVTGNNFVSQSTVTVNGNIRRPVSSARRSCKRPFFLPMCATAGTLQIAVVNPPPGGGSSNSIPPDSEEPVAGPFDP